MASKYKRFDSHTVPVQRRRDFEGTADTGKEHLRIALLGKTGTGKSSLANTIFRERVFEIGHTANPATSQYREEISKVNGTFVSLVDTPGFFDTRKTEKELKKEIARCVTKCSSGLHAFLILLKVERFTEQEEKVITEIKKYFSEEAFKYAVLVFTHGDQLPEGMQIEDYYNGNNALFELVEKCGGRCHVFDNKYWNNSPQDAYRNNERQIEKLLNTIKEMVENNRGRYTNEMLREVERRIQQEEVRIRASSGNMSQEEVREQAKNKVYNILKKAAGITTGVLLGALLGVPAMIASVVTFLKSVEIPSQALAGTAAGAAGAAAAAAAEGAAATGVGVAVAAGVAVTAGAIVGGCVGYHEADKADSVMEAVGNTAKAVGKLFINPVKTMERKDSEVFLKRYY